jgi:dCTP deaminase
MLSDVEIIEAIKTGEIHSSPPTRDEDIRPAGIRLHLSDKVLVPEDPAAVIDVGGTVSPRYRRITINEDGWILQRGEFALGASVEHIAVGPTLICHIDGRSTLARLGMMVHCGSSVFDNIHESARSVTFELVNVGPFDLRLRPKQPVALITFTRLGAPISQAPQDQYSGQSEPMAPSLGYSTRRSTP